MTKKEKQADRRTAIKDMNKQLRNLSTNDIKYLYELAHRLVARAAAKLVPDPTEGID